MIKKCEQLLAGLKESLKLAQEIQKEVGGATTDVMHITFAIQIVTQRISYHKNLAEKPKAEKPKAEKPKAEKESAPANLEAAKE